LVFIDHKDFESLEGKSVLIRAHGEPPQTYRIAKQRNLSLIDGTCPIVQALQIKIKKGYEAQDKTHPQILIYGKEGHPEVKGLMGQIGNDARVVKEPEDIEKLDLKSRIILYSQTTMDTEGFDKIAEAIKRNAGEGVNLQVKNTICKHISHREPGLRKFAAENDLLIFVAGRSSSNGRVLFEICKEENPKSILISEAEEIKPEWFKKDIESVGICGATSTPGWLLEEAAGKIKGFTEN
jgi:4-hydroxy-3-methylbut-2-enyl diphosphate reductase